MGCNRFWPLAVMRRWSGDQGSNFPYKGWLSCSVGYVRSSFVLLITCFNLYFSDFFTIKIPFYYYFLPLISLSVLSLIPWYDGVLPCWNFFLMAAILLSSLMVYADVCFKLCLESVSDISVANNTSIGAGSVLRFPSPYFADE